MADAKEKAGETAPMKDSAGKPAADKNAGTGGGDQVQASVNKEQEQGFLGFAVDQTPDENYSVAGVIAGKPTPETDAEAKAAAIAPPEVAAKKAAKK